MEREIAVSIDFGPMELLYHNTLSKATFIT
jgi:hypothetical protein